ncbi:MAG: HPP family protein [Gemmatimonadetes bacterium]|nr:HPP family protein [Gemmatimonadota bacterium]
MNGKSNAQHPWRVLDPKFRHHAGKYVFQCVAAMVAIFLTLTLLDAVKQTVLVAALGASSFIVFTMPRRERSKARYLIGGYAVSIAVGILFSFLNTASTGLSPALFGVSQSIAFAAMATGIAMFLMVVTDTEHPPAAGLALGFVLNEWDLLTIAVVIVGICAICAIKGLCRSSLMDLI